MKHTEHERPPPEAGEAEETPSPRDEAPAQASQRRAAETGALALILEASKASPAPLPPDGVIIGTLSALSPEGPQVTWPSASGPVAALTTVAFAAEDIGASVALLFQGGDPTRPVILGRIITPPAADTTVEVHRDNERISLVAQERIELRCGDASITLTRAGKVIIKGKYVVSHSSGTNRLRGGSIHLN